MHSDKAKARDLWLSKMKQVSGISAPDGENFVQRAHAMLKQYRTLIDYHQTTYADMENLLSKLGDAPVKAAMPLTKGQQKALNELRAWRKTSEPYFVLRGYAGTGKTHVISLFADEFSPYTVLFTAPTNKATKVLKTLLPNHQCRTIYSALSLKMAQQEDELVLKASDEKFNLSGFEIVFVDEGSMLNTELMEYIDEISERYNLKFVFICDVAQLPPINEAVSPVAELTCTTVELTEVVRHKNQILTLATHIREAIVDDHKLGFIDLSDFDGPRSVWQLSSRGFIEKLQRAAKHGFHNMKAIAWRNRTVDYLNDVIRNELYTLDQRKMGTWLPGDRIVVTEPIGFGARTLATTDDEGIVATVDIGDDVETGLKCYFLNVKMEVGTTLQMRIIHELSEDSLGRMLGQLASEARKPKQGKLWQKFWGLKNRFNSIRHSYAITAHRSQGSTFDMTFVDAGDILANHDRDTAYRCLYVAASRPSKRLYITGLPK